VVPAKHGEYMKNYIQDKEYSLLVRGKEMVAVQILKPASLIVSSSEIQSFLKHSSFPEQ
jgi:hypothetical protein